MTFFLAYIFCAFLNVSGGGIDSVRKDFHSLLTEKHIEGFLERYKEVSCEKSEPYLAAVIMQKARFTFFPNKKMDYFNEGKKRMEAYITKNPKCIEGRYVRFLVQKKLPKILNYSEEKLKDEAFIRKYLDSSKIPKWYKEKILTRIKIK